MIIRKEITCTLAHVKDVLWYYSDTKVYLFNWLIYKASTLSSNKDLIEIYSHEEAQTLSSIGYKKPLDKSNNEPTT